MTNKLFIVLIVVGIALAGGIFLFRNKSSSNGVQNQPMQTATNTPIPQKQVAGTLSLSIPQGDRVYGKGEKVDVLIVGDSAGEKVTGYDAVIEIPADVKVEVQKEREGYKVVSDRKDNRLTISGVKNLENDNYLILQNTMLATLTITVNESPINLNILFTGEGKTNDSNLITSAAHDILSETKGVMIQAGNELVLGLNKAVSIDNKAATVELKEVSVPEKNCADCMTTATLNVIKDGSEKEIAFRFGGIAGFMTDTQEAHGYTFSVNDVKSKSVKLLYHKN